MELTIEIAGYDQKTTSRRLLTLAATTIDAIGRTIGRLREAPSGEVDESLSVEGYEVRILASDD